MASLLKEYSDKKIKGQIFTPSFIIDKILDDVGYRGSSIIGKKIIDPACGDGRFLEKIVERIIKYSNKKDLIKNLENVYGWDSDGVAVKEAIERLNRVIKPLDINIKWNIMEIDSLKKGVRERDLFSIKEDIERFDFIVGNPPYIRIQHLKVDDRKFIQSNYNFCKLGSTDIYIAFYELALRLLKDDGIVGYITPNSFFHTDTARELRRYFEDNQNLIQITNYKDIQLFDDASTYSAITIFDKKNHTSFKYQEAISKYSFKERFIEFSEIKNRPFWQLSLNRVDNIDGKRLGDIAQISVGITTLADKIYIMPFIKEEENYIYLQSKYNGIVKLERGILKPIIKVSKLKSADEPIREYIIFPYKKIDGKNEIISEDEFKSKYPLTYIYLLQNRDILDKRDNGKPNKVAWYAFGRSQGLNSSFGKKILFSPMNKEPNFILSQNEEATFYSGYSIKYDGDYHYLLEQLNSDRMREYIQISSKDLRGGWKAYNKKIVQEFIIK